MFIRGKRREKGTFCHAGEDVSGSDQSEQETQVTGDAMGAERHHTGIYGGFPGNTFGYLKGQNGSRNGLS